MKLLLDENLSQKIIDKIAHVFPESRHISMVSLSKSNDYKIWEYAKENNFCILTKDWDFHAISILRGCPPKVVRLNCGNRATSGIISIIIDFAETIHDFSKDIESCYLEIE